MGKSETTKINIVDQTIALIDENNGDIGKITIRKIAERSGISIGLINHYFESKDILIEHCVQKIIGGVICSFKPDVYKSRDPTDNLKCTAKQVMDFLMKNQQISRISILGDLTNTKTANNTMKTVLGFANCISNAAPTKDSIQCAFILTMILQASFLQRDYLKENLGIDFYNESDRNAYIDNIVEKVTGCEIK